jgi:hypothetical protein
MLRAAVFTTAFIVMAYSMSLALAFDSRAESADAVASGSLSSGNGFTRSMSVSVLKEPNIAASASADSGSPGDSVTVSFSSDPDWIIDRCSAQFPEGSPPVCALSGTEPSVELTVPENARTGATAITWYASYRSKNPVETITPECCTPAPECCTPESPQEPGPEGGVKVNSLESAVGDEGAGDEGGGGDAQGTIIFTVLAGNTTPSGGENPPPGGNTATDTPSSPGEAPAQAPGATPAAQPSLVSRSGKAPLVIGVPLLIGVLAAAGLIAARIARRARAGSTSQGRGRSKRPQARQRVRAVPHLDPDIQVTTQQHPKSRMHVVRLEPRGGTAVVDVQEVGQ